MNQKTFLTKSGLEKLKAEIYHLRHVESKACIEAIADARDKGDLSENSEFDVANENYDNVIMRINNLSLILNTAVVIHEEDVNTDIVQILTTVSLKNKKTNKELSYTIVPNREINIKEGKISVNGAVAQALIGKTVGDSVKVKTPSGEELEFEILNISI